MCIRDSVNLTGQNAERGPYALNNGYASPTGSLTVATTLVASGTVGNSGEANYGGGTTVYHGDNRINLKNIKSYAKTKVDRISIGQLTHSIENVDFGLEI